MTIVFVHRLPETARIWNPLRRVLGRDSVAVALPGFGVPRPAGFAGTKDAYAQWLATTLAGLDGPIDLVGHDIGALLTLRVATAFDIDMRSYAVDVAPIFHPDAAWPARVQKLQTPGVGEELMRATRDADPSDPDSTAARLADAGVPADEAKAMGAAHDEAMSRSILDFYRSAVRPGAAAARPARGGAAVTGGGAAARRADGPPG